MGVPDKRYSVIVGKNEREICLLRGFPVNGANARFAIILRTTV